MKKSLSKDSRFGSRPATGFTDDLVEMVCQKAELLVSREAVQQHLPVWKDSHTGSVKVVNHIFKFTILSTMFLINPL